MSVDSVDKRADILSIQIAITKAIAIQYFISFLRKKNVEQTVIDDNQWNRISDTQIDDALNNESEEQIEKLQQALTKLTAEERALVTLFYEEEHSIQELAQILNLNEGNIKVKLHRLRKKLYVLMPVSYTHLTLPTKLEV